LVLFIYSFKIISESQLRRKVGAEKWRQSTSEPGSAPRGGLG